MVGLSRAASEVEAGIGPWLTETVARESRAVYELHLGTANVSWLRRRLTFDSVAILTRDTVNFARPQQLATLTGVLRSCEVQGVEVIRFAMRRGFDAKLLRCNSGALVVRVPPRPADSVEVPPSERRSFLVRMQAVELPAAVPVIRIGEVDFPSLAFDFRSARAGGGRQLFEVEKLRVHLTDFHTDPGDSASAARPLMSGVVELSAVNVFAKMGTIHGVRIAEARASVSDSTLQLSDVVLDTAVSAADVRKARPWIHTLTKLSATTVAFRGLDLGALVLGDGVRARTLDVDSLRVLAAKETRRPVNPHSPFRRTPQAWIAALGQTIAIDTLRVNAGQVSFSEIREGRDRPGVVTFDRISATATNVSHRDRRANSGDVMTLVTRSYLQNEGQLDATFVIPLDAPTFAMRYYGTLGPMSARAFNAITQEITSVRVSDGQIAGISYDITVRDGVSIGTVTPRYSDLSVSIEDEGSSGLLAGTGGLSRAARGVAGFAVRRTIRSSNPERAGDAPIVGAVRFAKAPVAVLPIFLWHSLRSGLMAVVRK